MNFLKKIIASFLLSLLVSGMVMAGTVLISSTSAIVNLPMHEKDSVTESAPFFTYDISGNNNDGELATGASEPTKLTNSNGFSFDGVSDRIRGGTTDELLGDSEFSLAVWLTADDIASSQGVITIGNPFTALGASGIFVGSGGNAEISVEFAGGNSHRTASSQYTAGETFFLVMTKTAGAIDTNTKIYKNASEISSATSSTNTPNLQSEQYVVGSFTTSSNFFEGDIFKAQIYDYALSQAEIDVLYEEGKHYQITTIQDFGQTFVEPFFSQANVEARGGALTGDPVISGGMVTLDGNDDVYYPNGTAPNFDNQSEITIIFDFETSDMAQAGNNYMISLPEAAGNNGVDLRITNTTVNWDLVTHSDSSLAVVNTTISANTKYRFGLTYDGTTLTGYSNGSSIGSDPVTVGSGIKHALGELVIGNLSSSHTSWVIGDVENLVVSNKAYTTQQMLDDFNNHVGITQIQDFGGMFREPFISQANTEARDGVITGTPTISGGVGTFDGTDSIEYTINNGDKISGGNARTFRTRLKFTGNGGALSNLVQGSGTQEYAVLAVTIGATDYMFSDGINAVNNITWPTSTLPNDGNEHHFVFTLDGSDGYEAYLDGVSIRSGTFGVAINTIDITDIQVAKRGTGGGDIFPGNLNDLLWAVGEWSAAQVLSDFNNS